MPAVSIAIRRTVQCASRTCRPGSWSAANRNDRSRRTKRLRSRCSERASRRLRDLARLVSAPRSAVARRVRECAAISGGRFACRTTASQTTLMDARGVTSCTRAAIGSRRSTLDARRHSPLSVSPADSDPRPTISSLRCSTKLSYGPVANPMGLEPIVPRPSTSVLRPAARDPFRSCRAEGLIRTTDLRLLTKPMLYH